MKTKVMVVLVGVLFLAGFRATGWHGRCDGDPERAAQMVNEHIDSQLDDLDATEAQRKEVHALADELIVAGRQVHEHNRAAKSQLVDEMVADSPDKARVHGIIDERAEAVKAFAHRLADGLLAVHQTLTPEQRAQLAERVQKR